MSMSKLEKIKLKQKINPFGKNADKVIGLESKKIQDTIKKMIFLALVAVVLGGVATVPVSADTIMQPTYLAGDIISTAISWLTPYKTEVQALVYILLYIAAAWYSFKPSRDSMKHAGDKDYKESGKSILSVLLIFGIATIVSTGLALGIGSALGSNVGNTLNTFK